jgi:hypothetical protein
MVITINKDLSCSPDNGNVTINPSTETLSFKDPHDPCVICFDPQIGSTNPWQIPKDTQVDIPLTGFSANQVITYQPYAAGTTTCTQSPRATLDHTITISSGGV